MRMHVDSDTRFRAVIDFHIGIMKGNFVIFLFLLDEELPRILCSFQNTLRLFNFCNE